MIVYDDFSDSIKKDFHPCGLKGQTTGAILVKPLFHYLC